MLYRVFKKAITPEVLGEIDRLARDLPTVKGATVEEDEASTRQCTLRWFGQGSPGHRLVEGKLFGLLAKEGLIDPKLSALENVQHTEYRSGGFHDWHIDAYRRSYNRYDLPLGDRFVGKTRKVSVSILLNDASEFTGGGFEVSMFPNGRNTVGSALTDFIEAGDVLAFGSSLCHRVAPVTGGVRKSVVAWICA